jgi:hypothetical protein
MTEKMSNRKTFGWFSRLTSTVTRCHLLGSITSIALIIFITWVWSRNQVHVTTIQVGDMVIDLNEATALNENADQWRQLYTVNFRRSQSVEERADLINAWLPQSVDWPNTEQDIRSIGDSVELTTLVIKRGKSHVGMRVGVVVATCEVEGSYQSLCRFLSELKDRPQPIACSEIKLQRLGESTNIESEGPSQPCKATLTLRIPFAAMGTAAGQLLPAETNHAS